MAILYTPFRVQSLTNHPQHEISWISSITSDPKSINQTRWRTVSPLIHISNPSSGDITNRTAGLICTDFRITNAPTTISGIKVQLSAQRNGRIVDDVIQLTYDGRRFGKNYYLHDIDEYGNILIKNDTVYGSETDLWDAEITKEMVEDTSFGVVFKFQSHPYFPHSCGIIVESVFLSVF